jgi:hypothetical protein
MTSRHTTPTGSESGGILVFVVAGMFGLMALSAAFLSSALTEHAAEAYAVEAEHAMRFAEAGTDFALHELDLNQDFGEDGIGNATFQIEGGAATVTIAPVFNGSGTFTLHSVGTHNQTRRAIDTVVTVKSTRFSSGFFGKDSILFTGSYMTDSYDSTLGPYTTQVGPGGFANGHGDVISNGNIQTSGGVLIHGDARPGPTHSYIGSPAAVTGTTAPMTEDRVLEPYTYNPPIPSAGNLSSTTTLNSGNYRYTQFTVGGGKVVTINGSVVLYVDSTFTVSGSGKIVVSPGANLVINHKTNDMTISGSGLVNMSSNPLAVTVFSATTGKVEISGSAAFFGAVYAPGASFVSTGGSNIYGAVVARTMTLSSARLHYDEALGNAAGSGKVKIIMTKAAKP